MPLQHLEDFRDLREKNAVQLKEAKEAGRKVAGIYCTYCPRELVLAAGAIPVGLCGTREAPIAHAERELPRNLCTLIKSSYGFAITDTCPFFHFSDLVIGETTCDGKKKMFEQLHRLKTVHVMNLPNSAETVSAVTLWHEEMIRLKARIEEVFQVVITEENLREAIHLVNEEKRALKSLFDLNRRKPALLSGMEMMMTSFQAGFHVDRREVIRMIDILVAEIQEAAAEGRVAGDEKTPRVLLTGTPIGMGSEKVVEIVENLGALVVVMENCGGYKTVDLRIDESDPRDPLLLLAEKYIRIPCSVMSPNRGRLDLLERMIDDFQIDGVIDLTWQGCHTYNIESFDVSVLVKEKRGLPFIQIETDYSQADRETLRVRLEAFVEMMEGAGRGDCRH
jgi:benzoyl-CoA reductase/2-hydroxyglutaryl-CoA dehydratase subunit BcrC/BadD/HgdB